MLACVFTHVVVKLLVLSHFSSFLIFLLQWLLLAYSKGLCVLWDLTSDEQETEPARKYTDISKDEKMVK